MPTPAMYQATSPPSSGISRPRSETSRAQTEATDMSPERAVPPASRDVTSDRDRQLLLRLAREAIEAHVGVAPAHVASTGGVLGVPGGAFVSLHKRGDLRGCIGHIEPNEPLGTVVTRCAVAAAAADPRFPPITP